MQKSIILLIILFIGQAQARAQSTLKLDDILSTIAANHPSVKMYDADIRSSDEAAKGARSWEAPKLGTGFWMTPYNPSLWKRNADGSNGMGQYIISTHQLIPTKTELDPTEKSL